MIDIEDGHQKTDNGHQKTDTVEPITYYYMYSEFNQDWWCIAQIAEQVDETQSRFLVH